ncbi:MAG: DJ-1/PfpI family protein [Cyclobacteriaceae bacterium]|nr:MAG: DJ-1/PfpI family protein [Cyclobacteriaceae bacterium]
MKKIAIVLFDEVEVLDFAGPFEVFSVTGKRNTGEPYEVFTVAEKETITARNNLVVKPTYLFENAPAADIFLVPGGGGYYPDGKPFGSRREMDNPVMVNWVKQQNAKAELVLSVCTGALILAKAGLLEGLLATTHFMAVDTLKQLSPTTKVLAHQRYVDNGKVILSAGVSAGIDMAFYVVARLQGPEVALETARYMQYDYWK